MGNGSTDNAPTATKNGPNGNSLFSCLANLISLFLVILCSKHILKGQKLNLSYLYACWIMWMREFT